ncbi:DUF2158 domain-containing protein [Janthinobacterium fluminis]|uniref:DUF2158 domain-containing protein n=1 Tax=Janthinobacterium fluminis TaxID=2987524 RepID=A0ABT5K5K8_9BURK|nr:DUF2158 domain-containing protein [Janthinobacterium fluminis]MDC8759042.1 DUF2158 domain-containing protein [Janthinobacterium fluminis]
MSSFTKGMVVQLVSGGQKMSVADVGDYSPASSDGVKCVWFDAKNIKCEEIFDAAILKEFVAPSIGMRVTRG